MKSTEFDDKLKDSMFWYLTNFKPFIINNEYQLDLLCIDFKRRYAKIKITNIKDESFVEKEINCNER